MPELPEVETIVLDLRPRLVGRVIEGIEVTGQSALGQASPEVVSRQLTGSRVVDVSRRGKNILVHLSGGQVVLVHLRMSGRLVIAEGGQPEMRFQRLAIRLDSGEELRLADLRKFARLRVLPAAEVDFEARLGPEPLSPDFTAAALGKLLARRRGRLKPLLLDQSVVAGIGNIYADEALFVANIHPQRIAASLTTEETDRLHRALREVLNRAIANRGTTFSDYVDGRGMPGANQGQLLVYRRTNQPCPRCGTPIERLRFGGRGTHFCPRCQPRAPGWCGGDGVCEADGTPRVG